MRKTAALFGGSFNPPHPGHFEMMRYIYRTLGVDEVRMIFSVNRLKDAGRYAPLEDRMNMAEILAASYPDVPIVFSDIESRAESTHRTADTLKMLKAGNPDTDFIWVMGADNLADLHRWADYDYIMENFPIAVVDRPPYTDKALLGRAALEYGFLRIDNPKKLKTKKCGWCFLDNTNIDMSSSNLLAELKNGRRKFGNEFDGVAEYIFEHNLYGINCNCVSGAGTAKKLSM